MTQIAQLSPAPEDQGYHYQVMRRAIALIDEAEDPKQLDWIAGEMGMSAAHFQRLFSRWVGVSPKRYQQYLMLDQAKVMLRDRFTTLAAALAGRNATSCYVPRTPGHSSYYTARADDDQAMTDWWALANAEAIIAADLKCIGKTADSCTPLGQRRRGRRFSSFSRTAHRLRLGKKGILVYVSV